MVVRFVNLCVLAVVGALGFLLSGCTPAPSGSDGPSGYPYKVTATVGMVADITRAVAGDKAKVSNIIGEGVDPHLYKPTRADIVALSEADVIVYNGLTLEGKMGDVLVKMAGEGKPVLAVTERILEQGDYVMTDAEDHFDPHVWMDVRGWMRGVEVVRDRLSAWDPDNAEAYASNASAYLAQLEALDAYARQALGSIPEGQRFLVTAHDAFGYLGRAYGLEVHGIQGLSTESEAGVRDIEALVRFLVERDIPAVFAETSVADKNVRALLEGTQARGHTVRIGGELFSDAMGAAGTYEGTYIGMIDHNVTTIARALGGTAPARGFQGKLNPAN
ncbi:MAG: metal ABC transporter solute-binding protein, Zn/Mn family [Opitutales bacterium]